MATNTFPALDIRPQQTQQQVDPLGQMGKMVALRSNMLQLQQQQMQMQSQQALMQAYNMANGDPDQTIKYAIQSQKVLPGQLVQFQQASMKYRQDLAGLTKDQLTTMQTQHAELRDAIDPIMQLPPDQQVAAGNQLLTRLHTMDPQQRQLQYGLTDQQLAQLPPGGITSPDQLKAFESTLSGSTKAIEDQLKTAQVAETRERTATEIAERPEKAWKAYSAQEEQQEWNAFRTNNPNATFTDFQNYKAASKSAAEAKATQPYKLQEASTMAAIHEKYSMEMFDNRDLFQKVETGALTPYNAVMDKVAEAKDAITQAQQTHNIVAARAAVAKLAGVEMPAGAGRMASKLYDQQFGSLGTQWASKLKGMFTGDQWTPQMTQDALAYIDSVGTTATNSANRKIGEYSRIHGRSITPLDPYQPSTPAAAPSATPTTPNAVRVKSNRDGKWHWADRSKPPGQQDLGLAPQ